MKDRFFFSATSSVCKSTVETSRTPRYPCGSSPDSAFPGEGLDGEISDYLSGNSKVHVFFSFQSHHDEGADAEGRPPVRISFSFSSFPLLFRFTFFPGRHLFPSCVNSGLKISPYFVRPFPRLPRGQESPRPSIPLQDFADFFFRTALLHLRWSPQYFPTSLVDIHKLSPQGNSFFLGRLMKAATLCFSTLRQFYLPFPTVSGLCFPRKYGDLEWIS